MNKNLKKVISTVAALAISASAVSAFAVDFPDVPADSNYYQAVQELSALDIISGFDDGTFRPDELVTRAQITKMIVDGLNERESAEASKANSKFADVSADHWAKGYINQGVADEFIAGYSDTEFGPDDNVTYVQAQKMLVSAMGYETYAQNNGGWPNGYKMYAASQGVTTGITGIADDQQLTRAQVARLLDNAMNSPVCVIDDYETLWNGTVAPKLKIKDGEGKEYQTLFTKKHDAYKVYGRVTETNRTGNGGVDTDKVKFDVEKADNFDDKYVTANNVQGIEPYIGDTNADEMEGIYAQALIQKDSNDEWTILSIVAAAAGKSVELATDDYDTYKDGALYFFPAGTTRNSTKYELAANGVTYYVNDVKQNDQFTVNDAINIIRNNTTGTVTLMKSSGVGTTSSASKYDTVYITVYATAVVDEIVDKTDYTTVNFKAQSDALTGNKASMRFEKDDDTKKYTITLNGEAIDVTDLQEDDVLTIKYAYGDFANSSFYDVQVSRDTVDGRYTGTSGEDGYKFDGTVYKFAYEIAPGQNPFATSTDYTLNLDVFGKIANYDEVSSSKKIGILKSVYRKNNGDFEAELIDKSAVVQTYTMDEEEANKIATANAAKGGQAYVAATAAAAEQSYISGLGKKNADFVGQVVEYKVNSSNKLTINNVGSTAAPKYFVDEVAAGTDANKGADAAGWGTYRESTGRIGTLRLSAATTIIDLSGKDDTYKVITEDSFDNDAEYKAYGYDYNNSDSSYRYVLVFDNDDKFNSKTQLAVFVEKGTDTNDEGDEVDTITVAYNGEEELVTLTIDEDYKAVAPQVALADLTAGEPIIFSTTTAGDVDGIYKVFSADMANAFAGEYADFQAKAQAVLENNAKTGINGDLPNLNDKDESNVEFQFGIITKDGNGVALVNKATYTAAAGENPETFVADLDDAQVLTISGAKVYTYNFSNGLKNNGRFVLDDGVIKTPDVSAAYVSKTDNTYNLYNTNVKGNITYAIVKTFNNDEVQEVYQIVAE